MVPFRRLITLAILTVSAVTAVADEGDDAFSKCDDLFQDRQNLASAHGALACFQTLMQTARGSDVAAYRVAAEYAGNTALWLYTQTTGSSRSDAMAAGLAIGDDADRVLPGAGVGPYWRATFRIYDCFGFGEAGCLSRHKPEILADLKTSRDREPSLQGSGPSRDLAILYSALSKSAGGNFDTARTFIREALSDSPNFSSNILESAQIEIKAKNIGTARQILEDFLANSCRTMDPNRIPECAVDQAKASSILKKLRSFACVSHSADRFK